MTTGGWLFMVVSLSAVTLLVGICFGKVLAAPTDEIDDRSRQEGDG